MEGLGLGGDFVVKGWRLGEGLGLGKRERLGVGKGWRLGRG